MCTTEFLPELKPLPVCPHQEEEMPDVEIDIDDLLDADSEEERASKLQVKSFQYLEFSDHGCLGLLGFPKPGYN